MAAHNANLDGTAATKAGQRVPIAPQEHLEVLLACRRRIAMGAAPLESTVLPARLIARTALPGPSALKPAPRNVMTVPWESTASPVRQIAPSVLREGTVTRQASKPAIAPEPVLPGPPAHTVGRAAYNACPEPTVPPRRGPTRVTTRASIAPQAGLVMLRAPRRMLALELALLESTAKAEALAVLIVMLEHSVVPSQMVVHNAAWEGTAAPQLAFA